MVILSFYSLLVELWIYIRWLVLKCFAVIVLKLFEDKAGVERTIIKIGNIFFAEQYPKSLFQNHESYVEQYGDDFSIYQRLLPVEKWLKNRTVLDMGSGLGQHSVLLLKEGAKEVVALEYQYSKALFGATHYGLSKVTVNASAKVLPFTVKTFDSVFSHTVFEHIPEVRAALENLACVLKDDGYILLSYNFIHHRGGHHLFPYIHFPWPTWIVSEKSLCEYWSEKLATDQQRGDMLFFAKGCKIETLGEGDELSLNKLNFEEFESLVKTAGLAIHERMTSEKTGQLFPLLLRIPVLKYFLSGTIYYVLRKRE